MSELTLGDLKEKVKVTDGDGGSSCLDVEACKILWECIRSEGYRRSKENVSTNQSLADRNACIAVSTEFLRLVYLDCYVINDEDEDVMWHYLVVKALQQILTNAFSLTYHSLLK